MSSFSVFMRLEGAETKSAVKQIEEWFGSNPKRRVCNADMNGARFKVRRKKVKEDIVKAVGTDYYI